MVYYDSLSPLALDVILRFVLDKVTCIIFRVQEFIGLESFYIDNIIISRFLLRKRIGKWLNKCYMSSQPDNLS